MSILTLQKKVALGIIIFKSRNCYLGTFFQRFKILKFSDKVILGNVLLISKIINICLPPAFHNWFTLWSNIYNYEETSSDTCKLFKPSSCHNLYGKNSVTINAVDAWNKAQTSFGDTILKDLNPNKIKKVLTKRMIDSY